MFNVEIKNPMCGAAYQVLFERFLPAYCSDRDRQAQICAGFREVLAWAKTQPPEVHAGYLWAIEKMTDDIEHRLKINDLGTQVQEVVKTIPRPPAEISDELKRMIDPTRLRLMTGENE
jgi:hypothetical protein